MKQIKTKRLILRSLKVEDTSLLVDFNNLNKKFLEEWEPARDDEYYSLESTIKRVELENESFKKKSSLSLYIFNRGDNKIIGSVTLSNIVYGPFLSCFLGYKLHNNEINKGKITEALLKVIDIAFKEYKLHRIEANVIPRNVRSKRVLNKLGFIEEGLSKKYLKINGVWEDHQHFVLLNSDVE